MTTFKALGLSAPVLRALEKHQFETPTAIQAQAIPALMEGHDLIGLADTGTGKTAAFLLPMLEKLLAEPINLHAGCPRALILAPTRELAQQIGQALAQFSGYIHLRSTVIYGGAPMNKQLNKLKSGVDILIATPGRLMDHVRRGSVRFDETTTFILDEADRMLDMGFVNDVKAISKALPKPHQTILFSATINKSVEGLTNTLLRDPVRVDIARKIAVSAQVDHCVMHADRDDKRKLLKKLLHAHEDGQSIIFTKTKRGADKLSRDLAKTGLKTDAIHGDRNQRQRQRTLNRFRTGAVDILIATDVAARGIDVPGIARVINFDLPLEPESYVHRVGRTGRNGETGIALSICSPEDIALLRDIEKLLKQKIRIDADHDFHIDPPAHGPRTAKKAGRGRPARPFKKRRPAKPGAAGEGAKRSTGSTSKANKTKPVSNSAHGKASGPIAKNAKQRRPAQAAKPGNKARNRRRAA